MEIRGALEDAMQNFGRKAMVVQLDNEGEEVLEDSIITAVPVSESIMSCPCQNTLKNSGNPFYVSWSTGTVSLSSISEMRSFVNFDENNSG